MCMQSASRTHMEIKLKFLIQSSLAGMVMKMPRVQYGLLPFLPLVTL